MLKNQITGFIGLFLLFTNLFGQNDNNQIPKNESFYIQSAINYGKNTGGVWDLPGGEDKIAKTAIFGVWDLSSKEKGKKDRLYKIFEANDKEYVEIRLASVAGYVAVKDGKTKNGTKLYLLDQSKSSSQEYRFKYVGKGKFKIYNKNGKLIALDKRSSKNGSKLILYDDVDEDWAKWALLSEKTGKGLRLPEPKEITERQNDWAEMSGSGRFMIQSSLNYGKDDQGFLEVPGTKNPKKNDNLQVWQKEDKIKSDRIFSVIPAKNKAYYKIIIAPNLSRDYAIEVKDNGYANGSNIQVGENKNYHSQNFYFKHLGNGKYNIFNENGKVIALNNGSSKNGSNVLLWVEHGVPSAEWYLIDTKSNKPFIPKDIPKTLTDIKINNYPGIESKKLSETLDGTYEKVSKLKDKLENLDEKSANSRNTIKRAKSATSKLDDLTKKIDRANTAIIVFKKIPVIKYPAIALSTTISQAKEKLVKANKATQTVEDKILGPTGKIIYNLNERVYQIEEKLFSINDKFLNTKLNYAKAAECVAKTNNPQIIAEFEQKSAKTNASITKINASFNDLDKLTGELNSMVSKIYEMDNELKVVEKQIGAVNKAFKKTDGVAKEISKVLNKKFSKKIGKLKLEISLKSALTGGKVGKVFKKFVDKWVSKLTKPLLKKMKIEIPSVNIDKIKSKFDNVGSMNVDLDKITKKITEINKSISSIRTEINADINQVLNVSPCVFVGNPDEIIVEDDDTDKVTDDEAIDEEEEEEISLEERQEKFIDVFSTENLAQIEKTIKELDSEDFMDLDMYTEESDNAQVDVTKSRMADEINTMPIEDRIKVILPIVKGISENEDIEAKIGLSKAILDIEFIEEDFIISAIEREVAKKIEEIAATEANAEVKANFLQVAKNLK